MYYLQWVLVPGYLLSNLSSGHLFIILPFLFSGINVSDGGRCFRASDADVFAIQVNSNLGPFFQEERLVLFGLGRIWGKFVSVRLDLVFAYCASDVNVPIFGHRWM